MKIPTVEELEAIRKARIIKEMRELSKKLQSEGKIVFGKDHK